MAYKIHKNTQSTHRKIREQEWFKDRDTKGTYAQIFQELRDNTKQFKQHTRITPYIFDVLLEMIRPAIEKQDTNMRKSIPAG